VLREAPSQVLVAAAPGLTVPDGRVGGSVLIKPNQADIRWSTSTRIR